MDSKRPKTRKPRRGDRRISIMSGTYTNLLFHVVYSTKYRKPLIKDALEVLCTAILAGSFVVKKASSWRWAERRSLCNTLVTVPALGRIEGAGWPANWAWRAAVR